MSYSELQGFKQVKGYMSSKLHITTLKSSLFGKAVTVTDEDGNTVGSGTINNSGICDIFTDACGTLTVTPYSDSPVTVKVDKYATYNVPLAIHYGFKIQKSNTAPASRVTAISGCDNESFTNASMNFSTGVFNYGSWENAFFMPRPCMVKYDGTVDYYLDPDDYTKKESGDSSDVANTSYEGNAMMEFPKVYLYTYEDSTYEYHHISNVRLTADYHCYAHLDQNGKEIPFCYMPIYNGSVVSGKLRSMSGLALMKTQNAETEINYAKANGGYWYTELLCDRLLVNELLTLIGMSTNTQTVFGQGANTSGTEAINDTFRTGVHNKKGLFYGTNSGTVGSSSFGNCVKVFGMENWWGLQWRRIGGWINDNGTQKIKLTYGVSDGSTVEGYNLTGSGYIPVASATPAGTSGGYINACKTVGYGRIPYQASGSETTYECDGLWFNNSQVDYACVGGNSSHGALVGAFCSVLNYAASATGWTIGASISCKPNAA